jgi:hypothetical protein
MAFRRIHELKKKSAEKAVAKTKKTHLLCYLHPFPPEIMTPTDNTRNMTAAEGPK